MCTGRTCSVYSCSLGYFFPPPSSPCLPTPSPSYPFLSPAPLSTATLPPCCPQNIGQMLKSHFKHSQFIIVSLKEGMFNNANVVFRTRFVDGVSTVTRHVNPRAALQSEDSVRKTSTAKKSTAAAPHPAKKSKKGIQAST